MIEVSRISRRFGRRWALADVSFELARGAALLVAGANGSGKSTLFRTLASAIRADHGTATIDGHDLNTSPDLVRRASALLTHPSYTYESLTALENLRIAARLLGADAGRGTLVERLARVGLDKRADDVVSTFSAGMRKRLALARLLLQDARVVFLDEPYAQLDPDGFLLIDAIVGELRAQGATLLIATHQLERGAKLCSEGLVLHQGRVAWRGTAADLPSHYRAQAGDA